MRMTLKPAYNDFMSDSVKQSIGEKILALWLRLSPLPGGSWLFSKLVGRVVPYTGTVGARVLELRPGYVRVGLRDHKRVRNHVNSIHAIALANLGEMASGIALLSGLPGNVRSIVTDIHIEYLKKARGYLVTEGWASIPDVVEDITHQVHAEIKDRDGDLVAKITVDWKLGVISA